MKNNLFCFLLAALVGSSVNAQLTNTKWKGILKIEDAVNVTFDFGKDTLVVRNLDENTVIETMLYSVKNLSFTLTKVSGQSDCDNSTIGKYTYQINNNSLTINLVEDACDDRAPVLDHLQLAKI